MVTFECQDSDLKETVNLKLPLLYDDMLFSPCIKRFCNSIVLTFFGGFQGIVSPQQNTGYYLQLLHLFITKCQYV